MEIKMVVGTNISTKKQQTYVFLGVDVDYRIIQVAFGEVQIAEILGITPRNLHEIMISEKFDHKAKVNGNKHYVYLNDINYNDGKIELQTK